MGVAPSDVHLHRNFVSEFEANALTEVCCSYVGTWLTYFYSINPLKPELNPICYLLALLGAHYFLHVSRIRVKLLTLR